MVEADTQARHSLPQVLKGMALSGDRLVECFRRRFIRWRLRDESVSIHSRANFFRDVIGWPGKRVKAKIHGRIGIVMPLAFGAMRLHARRDLFAPGIGVGLGKAHATL